MLDALGYDGWKEVRDYGKRWLVEIVFSSFKRVLGETLRSRRFLSQKVEASLKVMEMSCSYSQVFHTLEFRHGPKAIVSPDTCLTFFISESGYQAECEVLSEMKELGGVTIAVCNRANQVIQSSSDLLFELGFAGPELATLAPFVVPAQLLGFFTGIKKKLDPDHPKNLTRVVILV